MTKLTKRVLSSCAYGVVLLVFFALLVPTSSWGEQPQETPGVPSGTVLPGNAQAPEEAGPPSWTGQAFRQGVVVVNHPLAAEVGARTLEDGGNAIDAAAAIQFALNVVEPNFSGIGGGAFMMIHLAGTNETFFLDSREMAPAAATPGMFLPCPSYARSSSGIAVGVPGTLLGVATALERWGTISLAEALQPAIELAEDGFIVGQVLAANARTGKTGYQPETKAVFRPGGSYLQEGDLLVQTDLAETFRLIAGEGTDVFYRGAIAAAIVEVQLRYRYDSDCEGKMTLADLDAYEVVIREPIVGNYRGYTLMGTSPESSGGLTVMQMLKMLERFPLGDASQGFGFGTTKTLHVMMEAMRLAYADRAIYMGDGDPPNGVPVPTVGLLADEYVQLRSEMIGEDSRMSTPSAGDPWLYDSASLPGKVMLAALSPPEEEGGHTTHFSVVDKWGNVVSCTSTIEAGWGTGIMVPGYGFLLNNELTDFNSTPATGNPGANDVAPYKRPRSSMAPSILFKDGMPIAAYGSPGGPRIITTVLQITLNLIDHGMTIQEAIDAPRITVYSASGLSRYHEAGFSGAVLQELKDLGHYVRSYTRKIGSVQAVVIDLQTGKQYGGADSRREGVVIGLPRPRNQ